MALTVAERVRRYKARKRGEDVPLLTPGVPKGYKQTPEHIEKRKRWGEEHHAWKGDDILPRSGRLRAKRLYKELGPCTRCGNAQSERHHVNRIVTDNRPENIAILCRACHMADHKARGDFKKH
jgi:hypothetical protein